MVDIENLTGLLTLLNLLNKLGKKIRCEALLSILLVFSNEFNKFKTRVVGGSDYSPAIALSEEKDKLV